MINTSNIPPPPAHILMNYIYMTILCAWADLVVERDLIGDPEYESDLFWEGYDSVQPAQCFELFQRTLCHLGIEQCHENTFTLVARASAECDEWD